MIDGKILKVSWKLRKSIQYLLCIKELSGAFQQYSLNSLRVYNHPQAIKIVELYQLPSVACSGTTWASTLKIGH